MNERLTVLVVDDDLDVRDMIVDYLKSRGYGVLEATNGMEMLQMLDAHDIDLIVLDRTMPDGDGLNYLPRITQSPRPGIIALTSLTSEEEVVKGLLGGADDYVTKPFTWNELLARIEAVSRRVRAQVVPDTHNTGPGGRGRRVMAILFADIVDYTGLMEIDEVGTLRRVKDHRRQIFEPLMADHRGQIVKYVGDGLLASFTRVPDAVQFAVDVQAMATRQETETSNHAPLRYRIGINVASVIVEGGDIFGTGVNVAQRLQSEAEPNTVLVSAAVRHACANLPAVSFIDLGTRPVKHIHQPLRVYRAISNAKSDRVSTIRH